MKNATPYPLIEYEPGKKIDKAGIYSNVPMAAYHGDLCVGPSISSSGLRTIRSKSLAHYWVNSYLNPNRGPQEVKDAWIFGRAAHTLFLGEEGFREQFCIRPDTYDDEKTGEEKSWNGNANVCKRWLAKAALDHLDVLTSKDMTNIRGMAARLARHPVVQTGILNGLVEKSIVWPVTIQTSNGPVTVWLKARPDVLPTDSDMVGDYKTIAEADAHSVRTAITQFGYHAQLALADWGLFVTAGRRITDHTLVFQEKTEPWGVNHKPITANAITWGHRENWTALTKFAEAVATNQWPDYDDVDGDDCVPAGLMDYREKQLSYQDENHLLLPFDPYAAPEPETVPEAF